MTTTMVALMAVASAICAQAISPVYMVPVRQAGSLLGLVIARSTVKTDLVGCDSSIVSAAHTATSADHFSGPCVPVGVRARRSAPTKQACMIRTRRPTRLVAGTPTRLVMPLPLVSLHCRPQMVTAAVQMDPAGSAR